MFSRILIALVGLAIAIAPRKALRLVERVELVGYENPEVLEPKQWLLDTIRVEGLLVFLAAVITLALERRGERKAVVSAVKEGAAVAATKAATEGAAE